ncbi:hypothetical protein DID80_04325 [Candidatus Marinamargulisbacteria bacterium SCGC AAA071-K20]|nr:hypothetical protein DID80_04325 [Candidatus Marinamargulisbacteria bacterium SCGC AAA071-K20]
MGISFKLTGMDDLGSYLYHLNFFTGAVLALILGLILGISSRVYGQCISPRSHGLICLTAQSLSFLSVQLFQNYSNIIDLSIIVSFMAVSVSIISASMLFHYKKSQIVMPAVLSFWIVIAIGLFIGMGFWVIGVILTLLVTVFLSIDQWILPKDSRLQEFGLNIDISKLQTLERVEKLLKFMPIRIIEKTATKGQLIHLELCYEAAPLTQHLFLKRLFCLKGIERMSKVQ